MTLTLSGRVVRRKGGESPTLRDIGIALGRAPRFAGHCRFHWTVLHHSIAAGYIAARVDFEAGQPQPARQLGALLHDAHEAITGDIPTPWKTTDNRIDQYLLDKMIFGDFNMHPPTDWPTHLRDELHEWDRQLLAAEAALVGPAYDPRGCFPQPADTWLRKTTRRAVERTHEMFPKPEHTITLDTTDPSVPVAVGAYLFDIGRAARALDLNGVDAYARLEP